MWAKRLRESLLIFLNPIHPTWRMASIIASSTQDIRAITASIVDPRKTCSRVGVL